VCTPPANSHGVGAETPIVYRVFQSSHLGNWCEALQKNLVIGLKAKKTRALPIRSLPLPSSVERPTLTPIIVVDGEGVSVAN